MDRLKSDNPSASQIVRMATQGISQVTSDESPSRQGFFFNSLDLVSQV